MIIDECRFQLKNNQNALIRSPREEDIPGILDYLYISAGETEFILRYPEECSKYTPEFEKSLIERINQSTNEAMLLCIVDDEIAGMGNISSSQWIKTRHRAGLGIAILQKYWGLGIGTRLMQELIRIAERDPNILQLELDFVEGNVRAQALYEKMGFIITGRKQNSIRLKDGTLLDEISMIRKLDR